MASCFGSGCFARTYAPKIRAGELLLFDWRIAHRGLANASDLPRPVGYVTYKTVESAVAAEGYKGEAPSLLAAAACAARAAAAASKASAGCVSSAADAQAQQQ